MNSSLFLACVADPTRFALLERLAVGPCIVQELVDATGHTQSNISHHLKQLRDCGFVTFERDGKANRYQLSHPQLQTFLTCVQQTSATLSALCKREVCA